MRLGKVLQRIALTPAWLIAVSNAWAGSPPQVEKVTADGAQAGDGQSTVPPGMVLIPGGEFQMGDTFNEGNSNELPVHTVYLSPYYIDATEVTNAQYAAALNWALAQGDQITVTSGVVYKYNSGTSYPYCNTTTDYSYSRITWNGSTFGVVAGKEDHPMLPVTWHGAAAYANWRSGMDGKPLCYDLSNWACNFAAGGYRLPTEAEWEMAARGGTPGHRFPWSDTDTIQHARANYYSVPSFAYDTSPTRGWHPEFSTGEYPYIGPVGYFAPNGYGVYDMAGNVWEWCNDWYSESYYSSSPGSNPPGPLSGTYHVIRGSAWYANARSHRSAYRANGWPDLRYNTVGLRCALGPVYCVADLDFDGDVDHADFAMFEPCLASSGPASPHDGSDACSQSDLKCDADGLTDGDVDIGDFSWMQRCWSGSGLPADPRCADCDGGL